MEQLYLGTGSNQSKKSKNNDNVITFSLIQKNGVLISCGQLQAKKFLVYQYEKGVFQGHLLNGQKNGKGVFFWDSGEFYVGNLSLLKYKHLLGNWKNDQMNGEGLFYFAYGGYIFGNFSNGRIHGSAILRFPNNNIYIGDWKNGKQDGKCLKCILTLNHWILCEYEEGSVVRTIKTDTGLPPITKGLFKNDYNVMREFLQKRNVQFNMDQNQTCDNQISDHNCDQIGYQVLSNGAQQFLPSIFQQLYFRYNGILKNNQPNGLGIIHYPDQKYERGVFIDGKLNGLGRKIWKKGDIYHGIFSSGKMNGTGIFFKNKKQIWIYGKFNQPHVTPEKTGDGYPFELIKRFRSNIEDNKQIEETQQKQQEVTPVKNQQSDQFQPEKLSRLNNFSDDLNDLQKQLFEQKESQIQDLLDKYKISQNMYEKSVKRPKQINYEEQFLPQKHQDQLSGLSGLLDNPFENSQQFNSKQSEQNSRTPLMNQGLINQPIEKTPQQQHSTQQKPWKLLMDFSVDTQNISQNKTPKKQELGMSRNENSSQRNEISNQSQEIQQKSPSDDFMTFRMNEMIQDQQNLPEQVEQEKKSQKFYQKQIYKQRAIEMDQIRTAQLYIPSNKKPVKNNNSNIINKSLNNSQNDYQKKNIPMHKEQQQKPIFASELLNQYSLENMFTQNLLEKIWLNDQQTKETKFQEPIYLEYNSRKSKEEVPKKSFGLKRFRKKANTKNLSQNLQNSLPQTNNNLMNLSTKIPASVSQRSLFHFDQITQDQTLNSQYQLSPRKEIKENVTYYKPQFATPAKVSFRTSLQASPLIQDFNDDYNTRQSFEDEQKVLQIQDSSINLIHDTQETIEEITDYEYDESFDL